MCKTFTQLNRAIPLAHVSIKMEFLDYPQIVEGLAVVAGCTVADFAAVVVVAVGIEAVVAVVAGALVVEAVELAADSVSGYNPRLPQAIR